MRGRDCLSLRLARAHVALALLTAALLAGAPGGSAPATAAALALLGACALAASLARPAVAGAPRVAVHRADAAWATGGVRAGAPDRPGRPRPRAPAAGPHPHPPR